MLEAGVAAVLLGGDDDAVSPPTPNSMQPLHLSLHISAAASSSDGSKNDALKAEEAGAGKKRGGAGMPRLQTAATEPSDAGKNAAANDAKPAAADTSRVVGDAVARAAASVEVEAEEVTDSDSGILSDPEETAAQEERLEGRVGRLRTKLGLSHDSTLKQVFKLMDCLIGQYKLNRTDALLSEVESVCKSRGGDWNVKWIQSSAFCKWKQYKFKEALALFLEQQKIVGASAALCENIGHTYSSLGDLNMAEEYFEKAIELLKRGSFGNKGGIYLGLGLVRDRLGKTKEALPILEQALEHYQREHTKNYAQLDSSIIAKAHMSVGKAHEKLGSLEQASKHMAEALRIFKATVGDSSPLTAHAMGALGKVKASLAGSSGKRAQMKEALSLLKGSLSREIAKDAFHLESVWELFTKLKDLHMETAKQRQDAAPAAQKHGDHLSALERAYAPLLPLITAARARLTPRHEQDDAGTLAVFYKTVGEICLLAQDYGQGEVLLNEALRLLRQVQGFDCSSLIEGCTMLLGIAAANKQKQSATPHAAGPSNS